MSDPLRHSTKTHEDGSRGDTTAQIERLLISGLDLYFSGQYQDAINVWTRVAFLERGHGRARAYIERARSAIAEQHREADELVHRGRQAYDAGEYQRARVLLTSAIERSGGSDEALSLLHHLNRFDDPANAGLVAPAPARALSPGGGNRWSAWTKVFLLAGAVSAVALLAAPIVGWLDGAGVPTGDRSVAVVAADPPPFRIGTAAIERARSHYARGHLVDALLILARVDVGDPSHEEAVRLTGEIQRALLATGRHGETGLAVGTTP